MTQRAEQLRGFDPEFLQKFVAERQAAADQFQRDAAKAQREADAGRKLLKRLKGATNGQRS